MALLRCDFYSDVLGLNTSMTVLLPQQAESQVGVRAMAGEGDPPVLYLLHGLTDDDSAWTRHTSIERYVAPLGMAVVMPQVHRSFYTDEAVGLRFWTFLSEELPAVTRSFFRVSERRADTYVAGLSMGGYGALQWALRRPEHFAAAASLSGALDIAARGTMNRPPEDAQMAARLFGTSSPADGAGDLLRLLRDPGGTTLPRLYLGCGTEDHLYAENVAFRESCAAAGVPVTVDFGPGEHEWGYWDAAIQRVLSWLAG